MISPAPPRLVAVRYPCRMSRRLILLALALVAATIALRHSRNRADDSDTGATTQPAPLAIRTAPASVQEPQTGAATASSNSLLAALVAPSPPSPPPPPPPAFPEPLPSWDAKLVDVLPALKARADAGDHTAACHIGLALSACALWVVGQPSAAAIRQMRLNDEDTIERMARLSVDTFRPGRENTCKDLPAQALEQRFAYLQQAADAGNGAAMLAYAEGIPLAAMETAVRHPEWVEAHRRLAPRYTHRIDPSRRPLRGISGFHGQRWHAAVVPGEKFADGRNDRRDLLVSRSRSTWATRRPLVRTIAEHQPDGAGTRSRHSSALLRAAAVPVRRVPGSP